MNDREQVGEVWVTQTRPALLFPFAWNSIIHIIEVSFSSAPILLLRTLRTYLADSHSTSSSPCQTSFLCTSYVFWKFPPLTGCQVRTEKWPAAMHASWGSCLTFSSMKETLLQFPYVTTNDKIASCLDSHLTISKNNSLFEKTQGAPRYVHLWEVSLLGSKICARSRAKCSSFSLFSVFRRRPRCISHFPSPGRTAELQCRELRLFAVFPVG